LPDGKGTDLLKQAAKLRPFMGLILYTVLDDIAIQYTTKTIGAKYLSKPASRAGLGEAVKEAAKQVEEFSHEGPRKLLIAEDTAAIRDVIQRQLNKLEVEAEFAINGVEALKKLKEEGGYGILITDLHMPEMDGYQLTKHIRDDEEAGDGLLKGRFPIIALTADVQISQKQSYMTYGFDECLLKPVSLGQLKQMLVRWGVIVEENKAKNETQEKKADKNIVKEVAVKEVKKELPPALNKEAIIEQMGEIDEDSVAMLKSFIDMTRPLLDRIEKAFVAESRIELREASHSLKGAARSACCSYLGDLAADIQDRADREKEITRQMIDEIKAEFNRAEEEINKLAI